jgi:hypothetical protein
MQKKQEGDMQDSWADLIHFCLVGVNERGSVSTNISDTQPQHYTAPPCFTILTSTNNLLVLAMMMVVVCTKYTMTRSREVP